VREECLKPSDFQQNLLTKRFREKTKFSDDRLEVLTLTLVSVSVSDSVLVVWILIEDSVMEGEPLGQSLTTTEKRGERRRSEVDPRQN
jgi:hypothetical protein